MVSWALLATKTRAPSGEATTFHGSGPGRQAFFHHGAKGIGGIDLDDGNAIVGWAGNIGAHACIQRDRLRLLTDIFDRGQNAGCCGQITQHCDTAVIGVNDPDKILILG